MYNKGKKRRRRRRELHLDGKLIKSNVFYSVCRRISAFSLLLMVPF
jgi:hypothetical protein